MAAKKYRLKGAHSSKKVMLASYKGKTYNLAGKEFKQKVSATASKPEHERVIPAATDAILAALYEGKEHGDWSNIIEPIEEAVK